MIRINLLPHREEKRKARRQQFFVLGGLVSVLALVIVGAVHIWIAGIISAQQDKNEFLKKEIAQLEKDIDEIKQLKEQTQALLSRKQIIEKLQNDRAEVVNVLNEFARQIPEGVYLKTVVQSDAKINLTGFAQSNSRVSTLMRNLDASPWLERPNLVEIKAMLVDKRRLSEFNLDIYITRGAALPEAKKADSKPQEQKQGKT